MNNWLYPYYSWTDFLVVGAFLWAFYFLLQFLQQRLEKGQLLGQLQEGVQRFIYGFMLLYEPLVILILTLIFVFIQPVLHLFLLLLVLLAGFGRIKDYLSGRIILFNPLVAVGKRLKIGKTEGVVSKISRIGIYLQTRDGLHFINYSSLLTDGFAIVSGKEIGGYYQLVIIPPTSEVEARPLIYLENKLLTTPYLNKDYKPELSMVGKDQDKINARISVREEKHLQELIALLNEWGYSSNIAPK